MAKAPTKTAVLKAIEDKVGLCKIVVQNKPAQPAKFGVPNPFRPGETMDVAAKPARRVVKVRPLKGLKDMAGQPE